ncbi:MAG: hypothetical protein AB7U05_17760 [Mangrovibacterium sp.]
MEKYKIDSKYFDSLNLETLKNLLNEANSVLAEIQDSIKILTEKSNELFKIVVVITTALIGFIFTNPSSLIIQILTIYYILTFSFVIYKLYSVIYPKRNALVGTEPRNIIIEQMIGKNADLNEKRFVFVMLQSKQRAIDNNSELHLRLLAKYKSNIKLLFAIIAISIVIFLETVN